MAKAKVTHSTDGCTITFKGNPKNPEPSIGVIRFPGGHVEVSRTSDNNYWAHIYIGEKSTIEGSRLDYLPGTNDGSIPQIPDQESITKIAVLVSGQYEEWEEA